MSINTLHKADDDDDDDNNNNNNNNNVIIITNIHPFTNAASVISHYTLEIPIKKKRGNELN